MIEFVATTTRKFKNEEDFHSWWQVYSGRLIMAGFNSSDRRKLEATGELTITDKEDGVQHTRTTVLVKRNGDDE